MNSLCSNYINLMLSNYKNISSIIIYGSNIYTNGSSDLDVCIIVNDINEEQKLQMIKDTLKFHRENNLKIDEEVPHENKLIYTVEEVEEVLNNPPFYVDGKPVIKDIEKSKEFLASKEMKQRLLLNVLTTDHITVGASTEDYEKRAWQIMLDVVTRYFNIDGTNINEILDCLYTNRYTNSSGEFYLGYKKNYPQKEQYLVRKIKEGLN